MISSIASEDIVGLRLIYRGTHLKERARDVKDTLSQPQIL